MIELNHSHDISLGALWCLPADLGPTGCASWAPESLTSSWIWLIRTQEEPSLQGVRRNWGVSSPLSLPCTISPAVVASALCPVPSEQAPCGSPFCQVTPVLKNSAFSQWASSKEGLLGFALEHFHYLGNQFLVLNPSSLDHWVASVSW